MTEEEIWKDIPGYEGLYQVSNMGNVISLNYNKTGKKRPLKFNITKSGYAIVRLYMYGRQHPALVSRLVCSAFHKNKDNLPCVNHIDENKLNNRADNLEWCTYSYNTIYGTHCKRMLETRKRNLGEKAEKPVVQMSIDDVEISIFKSISEASRATGADRRKVSACCNGRRGKHLGYKWAFYKENGEV